MPLAYSCFIPQRMSLNRNFFIFFFEIIESTIKTSSKARNARIYPTIARSVVPRQAGQSGMIETMWGMVSTFDTYKYLMNMINTLPMPTIMYKENDQIQRIQSWCTYFQWCPLCASRPRKLYSNGDIVSDWQLVTLILEAINLEKRDNNGSVRP